MGVEGQEPGDWIEGTKTLDMSKPNRTPNGTTTAVTEYFEEKPWRRTYFVLDIATGEETTYDFDHDGKPEYAPILWLGNDNGNRYPPAVGPDGVIYQSNNYMSDPAITGGHISGWKLDTPFISLPTRGWNAVDEPQAYAIGGNQIYWNRCCDRVGATFSIVDQSIEWTYFAYNLFDKILPGYSSQYYYPVQSNWPYHYSAFGGPNGIYGNHGDGNPPIPYNGKIYMHRSNAILAFAKTNVAPIALPLAKIVKSQETDITLHGHQGLQKELEQEIQKMLDAGHLRPGYGRHGGLVSRSIKTCADDLVDYWHNPSETIYTLIRTLPLLPDALRQEVRTYIQNEFSNYPPYEYNHIGWGGAARDIFDLPDDLDLAKAEAPRTVNHTFKNSGGWNGEGVWGRNPFAFYSLWQYASEFGGAKDILSASRKAFETEFSIQPSDTLLTNMPFVHNAYIAGYLGFLELEKAAGEPESPEVKDELERLMKLRVSKFTKDSAYREFGKGPNSQHAYCRTLVVASNFMFLVPELAEYLRVHALDKVQAALAEYYRVAPYWFVTFPEDAFAENSIAPLYDSHALYMAKALILKESGKELERYLDIPGFMRGDLYHIQKLTATIEAYNKPGGGTLVMPNSVVANKSQ
ncbi:hypothetical protein KFU94_07315 [Chloroflexi bacterium TSY]|nr:hypothetical protein [Chloroflexi bacterium TSY]